MRCKQDQIVFYMCEYCSRQLQSATVLRPIRHREAINSILSSTGCVLYKNGHVLRRCVLYSGDTFVADIDEHQTQLICPRSQHT